MIKKFSVPRGTSDILPEDVSVWENVETSARRILKSYGYREIRTPIYEETALFQRSLGQTSDVVNKQLLKLSPTNAESPDSSTGKMLHQVGLVPVQSYVLRPEGTASIVRSYLENDLDKKEPLSKLFYIGPMFRGERPQKGRLRQFHQIGVEAIGPNSTSPYLDAEVIALAMHLLNEFGVKTPLLKINSLGDEQDKVNRAEYLRDRLRIKKNELCEDCQRRFDTNILRILDCKKEKCKDIVHHLKEHHLVTPWSKEHFRIVQETLKALHIPFEVDDYLVRGLDYYTHTVFEITAGGDLGNQDAVGAGGRYNGLIHELGGNEKADYGAIGFALGVERILLSVGHKVPWQESDSFVITMKEDYQKNAFLLMQQLR